VGGIFGIEGEKTFLLFFGGGGRRDKFSNKKYHLTGRG